MNCTYDYPKVTAITLTNPLSIGDKVYFESEKRPYTVWAVGKQFAICTKPFNLLKTVLYTIIDFKEGIRGPNDLVFNVYDYTVRQEIDECLEDLIKGDLEVSCTRRRGIDLDISRIVKATPA